MYIFNLINETLHNLDTGFRALVHQMLPARARPYKTHYFVCRYGEGDARVAGLYWRACNHSHNTPIGAAKCTPLLLKDAVAWGVMACCDGEDRSLYADEQEEVDQFMKSTAQKLG